MEALIDRGEVDQNEPLWRVINGPDVISILSSRLREETTGSMGGGSMIETFVWTEERNDCFGAPLFLVLDPDLLHMFLDVGEWTDYEDWTVFPEQLPGVD